MFKIELSFACFLTWVVSLAGQASLGQEAGSAQPWAKRAAGYSEEPIVYEYVRAVIRYENDGTGTRETLVRLQVNNAAGLARAPGN